MEVHICISIKRATEANAYTYSIICPFSLYCFPLQSRLFDMDSTYKQHNAHTANEADDIAGDDGIQKAVYYIQEAIFMHFAPLYILPCSKVKNGTNIVCRCWVCWKCLLCPTTSAFGTSRLRHAALCASLNSAAARATVMQCMRCDERDVAAAHIQTENN